MSARNTRIGVAWLGRIAVALVFASLLVALPSPTRAEDTIAELYRLSGAQEAIGQYPRSLEANLTATSEDTPPRVMKAMQKALSQAVDSVRIDSTCLARLRKTLNESTAREALKWLRTPTGRAVTEAERSVNSAEGAARLDAFLREGLTESDNGRIDLLGILDEATRSSETLAAMTLATRHAMALAFDATRPPEQQQGADLLWKMVMQGEAEARFQAREQIRASYVYVYRAISKDEIRQYIDFAASEAGLDYHRALTIVFAQTILDVNRELAAVLAREMRSE